MHKRFIIVLGIVGIASLGAWFVPPTFGAIKTSMQKKAERDIRDRHSDGGNLNDAKTENDLRTVPYGTGVYKLIR